jgi:hypothetical protein
MQEMEKSDRQLDRKSENTAAGTGGAVVSVTMGVDEIYAKQVSNVNRAYHKISFHVNTSVTEKPPGCDVRHCIEDRTITSVKRV